MSKQRRSYTPEFKTKLRMGGELEETVREILARVEAKRAALG